MPQKPKTGEKRKTRQPLKIDKLPVEMRDAIQQLRAEGKTWQEIEEASVSFKGWDKLSLPVLELFPDMKIPRSSLHRWYDLRVEQAAKEVLADTERARQFANVFAGRGFDQLPEAILNAMRDQIFTLLKTTERAEKLKAIKLLGDLGWLVSDVKRTKFKEEKLGLEKEKIETERKRLEEGAGDPREIYLEAAQDVLKKLLTRAGVREVIEPIKEDLVTEFSNAAESFAQKIEARAD
jgi:hypothetical protein